MVFNFAQRKAEIHCKKVAIFAWCGLFEARLTIFQVSVGYWDLNAALCSRCFPVPAASCTFIGGLNTLGHQAANYKIV